MTNKEAIKYLQQLCPNGGHCWLDEQRIEAIGMAINALQEEYVSEDLEEAAWLYYDKNRPPIPPEWDLHKEFIDFFKAGDKWQLNKIIKKYEKNRD